MRNAVALLLIWTLAISPVMEAMAQEGLPQEPEAGKVIVLSEKVGEIIDLEERNYYRLFLFSKNFQSAVILQQPDSSFVLQITEEMEGIKQLRTQPIERKILNRLRQYIDNFENLTPVDKARWVGLDNEIMKTVILNTKIKEAKGRAKEFAKEKWTKERWREESLSDRGMSYHTAGGLLGFTLGAAAGMLIGKGFQGKKVARQEYHEGGWFGGPWTENFYSYEHKYAPHWGAAVGGTLGAVIGYSLGKKADKEYYLLVPKHIRMEKTKSSWFGYGSFGFLGMGSGMCGITGWALYTPMSGRAGKKDFGPECVGGYLVGSIAGTMMAAGFDSRAKHKRLWEESLLEEKPESSLDIRFIPLDPTAFSIHPRKLPNGETFYEYRMNLLRVRF